MTHATANRRCTAENNVGIFGVKSNRSPVNTVHRTKNDSVETFGADMTRGTVPAIQKIQNTIETMQVVHGTASALEKKVETIAREVSHGTATVTNNNIVKTMHGEVNDGGGTVFTAIAHNMGGTMCAEMNGSPATATENNVETFDAKANRSTVNRTKYDFKTIGANMTRGTVNTIQNNRSTFVVETKSLAIQLWVNISTNTERLPQLFFDKASDGNGNAIATAVVKKQVPDQKSNHKAPRHPSDVALQALTQLLVGGVMLIVLCISFTLVKESEQVRICFTLWLFLFPAETLASGAFRPLEQQQQRQQQQQPPPNEPPPNERINSVAKTTVTLIGNSKAPVIVFDNVLQMAAFASLRDELRSRTDFMEGHGNGVAFPGKIAAVDWAIVDSLLDAAQHNEEVGKIYPSAMFDEQRAHVRGFASILCNEGWVHNDHMDTEYEGVVAPAAVFYFAFDGVDDASTTSTTHTGTAFYREKKSGLERVTSVVGNETVFCGLYPDSVGCPGDGGGEAAAGDGASAAE